MAKLHTQFVALPALLASYWLATSAAGQVMLDMPAPPKVSAPATAERVEQSAEPEVTVGDIALARYAGARYAPYSRLPDIRRPYYHSRWPYLDPAWHWFAPCPVGFVPVIVQHPAPSTRIRLVIK